MYFMFLALFQDLAILVGQLILVQGNKMHFVPLLLSQQRVLLRTLPIADMVAQQTKR
jgi:hypothetical protein